MIDEELYEFGYNEVIEKLNNVNNLIEKLPKEYACQDDLAYIAGIYTDLIRIQSYIEEFTQENH